MGKERDTKHRRDALAVSIRNARGRRGETELAAALGLQTATLKAWEAGGEQPSLEQLYELEGHLRISYGSLATAAGYVEPRRDEDRPVAIYPDRLEELIELVAAADRLGLPFEVRRTQEPMEDGSVREGWVIDLEPARRPDLL